MTKKDYKQAIIDAHYHPGADLVKAVMEDHDKLLDAKLIDKTFQRLYREPKAGKPESGQTEAAKTETKTGKTGKPTGE